MIVHHVKAIKHNNKMVDVTPAAKQHCRSTTCVSPTDNSNVHLPAPKSGSGYSKMEVVNIMYGKGQTTYYQWCQREADCSIAGGRSREDIYTGSDVEWDALFGRRANKPMSQWANEPTSRQVNEPTSQQADEQIVWLPGFFGFVGIVLCLSCAGWREPHSPPSMHQGVCFVWPRRTGKFLAGAGRWWLLMLLWQQDQHSRHSSLHSATQHAPQHATQRPTQRATQQEEACSRRQLYIMRINSMVSCWCVGRSIAWRNKIDWFLRTSIKRWGTTEIVLRDILSCR